MSSRPPPHPSPGFLVPVLSRLTDRAPQTASIFLRLTSAFVSPLIARASAQPLLDAAESLGAVSPPVQRRRTAALPPARAAEARACSHDANIWFQRAYNPILVPYNQPKAGSSTSSGMSKMSGDGRKYVARAGTAASTRACRPPRSAPRS
jgi:hypothetical protein